MYKPLPDNLTIHTSKVNGLGLFAKEGIAQGTNLGTCHIKIGEHILRTPLGGFINHSEKANCELIEDENDDYKKVKTTKKIEQGEELTLKYSLYDTCNYL